LKVTGGWSRADAAAAAAAMDPSAAAAIVAATADDELAKLGAHIVAASITLDTAAAPATLRAMAALSPQQQAAAIKVGLATVCP
jgi:hypothetical protein